MSEINSPNFRRPIAQTSQKPLREYNVGAPEDMGQLNYEEFQEDNPEQLAELEARMNRARLEKQASFKVGERISDPAKKRIEILTGIGRLTKDVEIGETIITLRTLKSKESRETALLSLKVETPLEAHYEARRQQLARAIYKIDGHDIGLVLGDDSIGAKLEFLDSSEESFIVKLFDEFVSLKKESNDKFSISTEAEAKEVSADLKK